MKPSLLAVLLSLSLAAGGCSRSAKNSEPPPNLPADAARLQQATANAATAKAREGNAIASPSPSATPP